MAKLDQLKIEYAYAKTEVEARNLGWLSEHTDAGLVVYCPSGGTLTVSKDGTCATQGFTGGACHEARLQLGLQVEEGSIMETAEACQVPVAVYQGK